MSDLNDNDYNGECFILGSAGEREIEADNRNVIFVTEMPFKGNTQFDKNNVNHQQHLDLFFRLNYHYYLIQTGMDHNAENLRIARYVAYIRTLAAREGQYDFTGTANSHNVRYTDFDAYNWGELQEWARNAFDDDEIAINNLQSARNAIPRIPNVGNDRNWQDEYRLKHTDVVCTVAYMFRVRGHHYTDEMDDRYKSLWRKCLYEEDTPGINWKFVAIDALHAIFPDDLDHIWQDAVNNQKCAGALVKRIDSLPAGVAGISALNAGVSDITLIVPRALEYARDAVAHLKDLTTIIEENRWAGSVNRRFYDAPNVVVDEAKLSALAAIIRAGLENLAPNSPLLKSRALQRIASNAAMTGAMVGRMVMTAARSEAAAEIFLPQISQTAGT